MMMRCKFQSLHHIMMMTIMRSPLYSGTAPPPSTGWPLAALLNPQYAELCGMNVQKMCQNIPFLEGMIPEIIKQAAESTRRLVVRITWDERGNARKALELETFITATPQAEEEG